ncbi:YqeG family HAD IIIA-type phosphatase [Candidatus Marinamargulisbacteria bacterium SCGC AG-439-L15]|nr:YqeG family HAD IIIA-type phosphatase [Candidatus Marinamargulisbacteria bacterium SCGC AG-439-L15]
MSFFSNYFFSINDYKRLLKSLLTPSAVYDDVESIDLQQLYDNGFTTFILDIDNTLMSYSERQISLQKEGWVEKVKSMGFRVFVVSNNSSKKRILRAAKQLDTDGLYFALKPFVYGVREFAEDQFIDFEKTVVVGDQLLTDIILGNWLRSYSVLVDPLGKKQSFIKRVQHKFERFLLKKV